MPDTMKEYHFVAAFTGECCTRPHLWCQSASGESMEEARNKVTAEIRAAGGNPSEIVEIPAPNTRKIIEVE